MSPEPSLPVDGLLARAPVRQIVDRLPESGEEGAGLRVDFDEAKPIVVDGEARLSLARIYSYADGEEVLLGQVQARGSSDDPAEWTFEFYLHDVERGYTDDYDEATRWWHDVASRHAVRHREVAAAVA
jgi:hypothetical protein